jgi:FSR family fosmidomycin resistance protein-like MFS transporter
LIFIKIPTKGKPSETESNLKSQIAKLLPDLWIAIRNLNLVRWILLLQMSDFLLDIFTGFVALYFADVVGLTIAQVGLLLSILMGTGFLSDLILIPLLERIPGRLIVRFSATIATILYITVLLLPWPWAKITLVILLRFSTIGWYQVLQGEAYATQPGSSGTVIAISSAAGVLGGAATYLIGWIASQAGLGTAMWFLLLGPLSLVLFVPRLSTKKDTQGVEIK